MSSKVKVWRASKNATAAIRVTEESVSIVGGGKSAIEVNKTGIGMVAKSVSFGMFSDNIRTAGMFTMMNDFAAMIPSTMVTPIAQRLPYPPLGFITGVLPIVPLFMFVLSNGL